MNDYVTDPELLRQLNGEETESKQIGRAHV